MAKKTRKKTLKQLFLALIILSVGYLFSNLIYLDFESLLSETITLEQTNESLELEPVTLKRVVDGDTIIVLDSNQNEVRVRMIGVDTPESVHVDSSKNTEAGVVTLKRVVDGDTIIVLDSNQNEVRVRMIGVDTPESVHVDSSKNTEAGVIASDYTKSQLIAGQIVYLEYDKERLDQYGRTLAYVWLDSNVDPTDLNDIQAKMYNAKLLVEGYAVAKTYQPNTKYSTIFKSIEQSN